jgi:hypothetical protein
MFCLLFGSGAWSLVKRSVEFKPIKKAYTTKGPAAGKEVSLIFLYPYSPRVLLIYMLRFVSHTRKRTFLNRAPISWNDFHRQCSSFTCLMPLPLGIHVLIARAPDPHVPICRCDRQLLKSPRTSVLSTSHQSLPRTPSSSGVRKECLPCLSTREDSTTKLDICIATT